MALDVDAFLDEPAKPVESGALDIDSFLDEPTKPVEARQSDIDTFLDEPVKAAETEPKAEGEMRAVELPWFEEYVLNPAREGWEKGKQLNSVLLREAGLARDDPMVHATRLAGMQRQSEKYGASLEDMEALSRATNAQSVGEFIGEVIENPQIISNVTLSSMGMFAPVLMATAGASVVGGPLATAGVAGTGSAAIEYSATIVSKLAERGLDPKDPKAWNDAFKDEAFMEKARESAVKRGLAIGAFDAITAGLAGKLLAGAKGGIVSPTVRTIGETGLQAGGGMAGEATAQLVDEGAITSLGEVLLEGVAEGPTAIVEVPGNIRYAQQQARKEPAAIADEIQSAATVDDALAKAQEIIDAPTTPDITGTDGPTAEALARAEEVFAGPTEEVALETAAIQAKTEEKLAQVREQEDFAERTALLLPDEIAQLEQRRAQKEVPSEEVGAKREQTLADIRERELKREEITAKAEKEATGVAREAIETRDAQVREIEQEQQKQQEYEAAITAAKEDVAEPTAIQLAMQEAAAKYEAPKPTEAQPITAVPKEAKPIPEVTPAVKETATVPENVASLFTEAPKQTDITQIEQKITSTIEQGKNPVYGIKRELGDDVFRYETYDLDGKRLSSSVTLKPRSTENQTLIKDELVTVPNAWKAPNYKQGSLKKKLEKPLSAIEVNYEYDGPKKAKADSPEIKAHVTELKSRADQMSQVLNCLKGK